MVKHIFGTIKCVNVVLMFLDFTYYRKSTVQLLLSCRHQHLARALEVVLIPVYSGVFTDM